MLRKARMGFEAPPVLVGTVEEDPENRGDWKPVVVAEEKSGFVVKDRRTVR